MKNVSCEIKNRIVDFIIQQFISRKTGEAAHQLFTLISAIHNAICSPSLPNICFFLFYSPLLNFLNVERESGLEDRSIDVYAERGFCICIRVCVCMHWMHAIDRKQRETPRERDAIQQLRRLSKVCNTYSSLLAGLLGWETPCGAKGKARERSTKGNIRSALPTSQTFGRFSLFSPRLIATHRLVQK